MSASVQEGMNRGVRMGFTCRYLSPYSSSHRSVSRADSSAPGSRRPSGQLRSMLTRPTQAATPVCSTSSMSSPVASVWAVAKMHALVLGPRRRSSAKMP